MTDQGSIIAQILEEDSQRLLNAIKQLPQLERMATQMAKTLERSVTGASVEEWIASARKVVEAYQNRSMPDASVGEVNVDNVEEHLSRHDAGPFDYSTWLHWAEEFYKTLPKMTLTAAKRNNLLEWAKLSHEMHLRAADATPEAAHVITSVMARMLTGYERSPLYQGPEKSLDVQLESLEKYGVRQFKSASKRHGVARANASLFTLVPHALAYVTAVKLMGYDTSKSFAELNHD